jgi:hypothetical protein
MVRRPMPILEVLPNRATVPEVPVASPTLTARFKTIRTSKVWTVSERQLVEYLFSSMDCIDMFPMARSNWETSVSA